MIEIVTGMVFEIIFILICDSCTGSDTLIITNITIHGDGEEVRPSFRPSTLNKLLRKDIVIKTVKFIPEPLTSFVPHDMMAKLMH